MPGTRPGMTKQKLSSLQRSVRPDAEQVRDGEYEVGAVSPDIIEKVKAIYPLN